jgi:hypothetical protein
MGGLPIGLAPRTLLVPCLHHPSKDIPQAYHSKGEHNHVQFPFPVVPDNMVVVHSEPILANWSYDVLFQPVRPFWVLEYVSKHSQRKDYEESFQKYERELKVPDLLLFYPEAQELTLYRHRGRKYVSVRTNAADRYAISALDLEVDLLHGWMRFWYKGALLPLPADLQRELTAAQRRLRQAQEQATREREHKERLQAQLRAMGVEPCP